MPNTINVLDKDGASVTVATIDSIQAPIGAVTETAPASDTASSGMNGRLQRIAQRLTSLIAALPAVFGSGTAAAAQRVTLASDDPAVSVLGARADAKSTATDTTSISAMSVWKQISASVQALVTALGTIVFGAGTAAAAQRVTLASDDPAVTTLGAKTDAKSAATDTTSVSGISVWKQISASAQALVTALGTVAYGAGTAAAALRVTFASDASAVSVTAAKSVTGTTSQVAGSASAVTILASNANRLGATIVNDSSAILYLILSSTTPSSSVYTVAMAAKGTVGAYYEVPASYTGIIKGIWASATGSAVITEMT